MAKHIRALTVKFDLPISYREIPLFRGAVLKSMGDRANVLYHNHTGDETFRYSYPLIQYKRLGGKAAIICVEEGADVIGQFFSSMPDSITVGHREAKCEVGRISPVRILVQTWEDTFKYHISRWLPLNSKNYQQYQSIEGMVEKVTFLENILKANLLSMLKGLDIHVEKELVLKITELSDSYLITNKGVKMMAFNGDFICNLSIPNNLGIGKNASIGCGVVNKDRKLEREEETEDETEPKES